jgi:hypothetical protein
MSTIAAVLRPGLLLPALTLARLATAFPGRGASGDDQAGRRGR